MFSAVPKTEGNQNELNVLEIKQSSRLRTFCIRTQGEKGYRRKLQGKLCFGDMLSCRWLTVFWSA